MTQSSIGILVGKVNNGASGLSVGLQIGSTVGVWNEFRDLDIAIDAVESTISVQNNFFENITTVNPLLNLGYGIRTYAPPSFATADALIGLTSSGANIFHDCRFGMYHRGMDQVIISYNDMKKVAGIFQGGIRVDDTRSEIEILRNGMTDYTARGIYLVDNPVSKLNVIENGMSISTAVTPITVQSGIEINQAIPFIAAYSVLMNDVSNLPFGIEVFNTESISIQDNVVTSNLGTAAYSVGIYAEGADNALIEGNNVDGNCPSSCPDFVNGIGAVNCLGVFLKNNTVSNARDGFRIMSDCTGGNAVCNKLEFCDWGFVFEDMDVGEFGPVENELFPGEPSDNVWFDALTAQRSYAIGLTLTAPAYCDTYDWYYRDVASFPAPPSPEHEMQPTAFFNDEDGFWGDRLAPIPVISSTPVCAPGAMFRDSAHHFSESHRDVPEFLSHQIDSLLEVGVAVLIPSNVYSCLELANVRGWEHDNVLNLTQLTNIEKFEDARRMLFSRELDSAEAIVFSINSVNYREELLEESINFLYTKIKETFGQPTLDTILPASRRVSWWEDLNTDQVAWLGTLAAARPAKAGSSVTMARALLRRASDEAIIPPLRVLESNSIAQDDLINVYPSPANDLIIVASTAPVLKLYVIDMQGLEMDVSIEYLSSLKVIVDVSGLNSGQYIVSAQFLDGSKITQLLNIDK